MVYIRVRFHVMKRNDKQREKVVMLRGKGLNYKQIASLMEPAITRQRAWQIYKLATKGTTTIDKEASEVYTV